MSGHTPGPWAAHDTEVYFANNAGGLSVAGCPNAEANARLIAAAPELLHCLKVIVCHAEGLDIGAALHLDKAMEAIAKAEGEA